MDINKIYIKGARQHNLKNIDAEIPKNAMTVITGLSGSGKSTLAFDTLYAEGQRRYVESLSTYARQFLGQMDKPDVDSITGLSPAISIEQKTVSHNPRSTVGTITEIYDYLRLLYARIGQPFCFQCGRKVAASSIDQIIDQVMALDEQSKIIILAPLAVEQKGSHKNLILKLKKQGFARIRLDDEIFLIDDVQEVSKTKKHRIDVVVDRLIMKKGIEKRLADSIELALSLSDGQVLIHDLEKSRDILFSEKKACIHCKISYPDFVPASFSFNSTLGACSVCDGLGAVSQFDPDLIVPDRQLSLRQGAVRLWQDKDSVPFMEFLDALVSHYNEDIYKPFKKLSKKFQDVLFYGSGKEDIEFYAERMEKKIVYKRPFEGIIPALEKKLKDNPSGKGEVKDFLNYKTCPACRGARLNRESVSVRIAGKNISEATALTITEAVHFFSSLKLDTRRSAVADTILKEINERLGFLEKVGLEYLSLERSAATLSGGESQRIRLATQIGSKLSGVLYVLDEPSIGLHQRDNAKLLSTLLNLCSLGNTVILVEHDEETIKSCDHVIDIGPGAGVNGGQIVFAGPPEALLKDESSLTGMYLSGRKSIKVPEKRRKGNGNVLTISKAGSNNLKNIDTDFPLGCFICVTGVSGSGKSTLVLSTLYTALSNRINHTRKTTGKYEGIHGAEHLDKTVHIDQSPIGKTPRSNPGTYTKVFDEIRKVFAGTREAKARGYKAGRFSFNVKGGRCEACTGDGVKKIEMHFLPDIYVTCDACKGRRYNRETLDIKYKNKNIAQVLDMTINQAIMFFENISFIRSTLETLVQVGLGYVKLGQSGTTLSGGEAQRMKLARELSKKQTGKTIYILDEPTTGLHPDDISKLLFVLNRLVDAGNTVIVIEHNLDVIKCADHVIDLGPEGGDKGGFIVASGTPEEIAADPRSYTGYYLKRHFSM